LDRDENIKSAITTAQSGYVKIKLPAEMPLS